MEQQIMVKTEVQSNGEILLFYVDENGGNEEGVITTVENIENQAIQLQQDNSFIIQDVGDLTTEISIPQTSVQSDTWTDDEIKRLLVFFSDNKQTFITGTTKKTHLWTVACKTMLMGKTPQACEQQLNTLQLKYFEIIAQIQKGHYTKWPYFELCHQVFEDESSQDYIIDDYSIECEPQPVKVPVSKPSDNTVMVVKKVNTNIKNVDEKVETMLNLYMKYKKDFQKDYWRHGLWETIAMELGQDDGEYWQKRFLNYKQHYTRLVEKRRLSGSDGITWPYMELFDKIFEGDPDFGKRHPNQEQVKTEAVAEEPRVDWDNTEMTVLVKYYFDCYDEFEDKTIPNNFLWNEIGRLLDKNPEDCRTKYELLKNVHLEKYIAGSYTIRIRKPIDILFDNIISKDIEGEFAKFRSLPEQLEEWGSTETDTLVQFFYENVEMYKDSICYYVCWSAIAKALNKSLQSCRGQWQDLVEIYKTVLNDKMENPDVQFDWQYIDLFDRIFDYGMDTNLLSGYEKTKIQTEKRDTVVGVKKINIKTAETPEETTYDDNEDFNERGFRKRSKRSSGESKAIQILEYYQKNKELFSSTNRNKHSFWEVLAKQIGISATQCAHRFRNLKQVYTAYVQREINKPDMPILWPYYVLCKKVFGYRALKSKLKNVKTEAIEVDQWSPKEIKLLIKYLSDHFDEINNNTDDSSKWSGLSTQIGKSENICREKFIELRKSYRKLSTMRKKDPDVNIMWKYYKMFEDIYNNRSVQELQEPTEEDYDRGYIEIPISDEMRLEGDDDYQCIIVMEDGQDLSQMEHAQIIVQHSGDVSMEQSAIETSEPKPLTKWTKRSKKKLLIFYINYVRSHKGHEIKPKDMWAEIAQKLKDKTPGASRKMFAKLKTNHKNIDEADENTKTNPLYNLMEKVMRLKPKFVKTQQNKELRDSKIYKDVILPCEKVELALQYYLANLEDFVSPKYEKKYLWTQLANHISEPVTKIFNKINFLKQSFNFETLEIDGQPSPFSGLLKDILEQEITTRLSLESQPKPSVEDTTIEETWSDYETGKLLEWYLGNLEKFKNPKFVRSYLWMEASSILNKTALSCSKKMSEIRTQYRNMVRETPEQLSGWKFLDLCQKIYGTGKKGSQGN